MTIPQADGNTEVTLHGPDQHLQNTLQTTASRGPACATSKRKKRRKPNTKRRPKDGNTARKRVPRTKFNRLTFQRVKGQRHQEESLEDRVLCLVPLQVSAIQQLRGGAGPHGLSETHDPTLDLIHPVDPGHEGGLIQDPEA